MNFDKLTFNFFRILTFQTLLLESITLDGDPFKEKGQKNLINFKKYFYQPKDPKVQ